MASPELARPLPSLCPWQSEAQSGRSSPDPGFCFCVFKIIDNDLRSQVVEDTLGKHSKLLKLNRPRLLFRHLKGDICKRVSFKDSLPCPRTCASSDSLVVSKCPSLKLRPFHQIHPLPSSSPSLKGHTSVTV